MNDGRRRRRAHVLALALLWPLAPARHADAGNFSTLRASVFKIHVIASEPNLTDPWKKMATSGSSGTGFYIGDGRILTNAHVIANASFITVLRDGEAKPQPAYVRFIAHDCDLAILEPADRHALDDLTPMIFGSLPKLRSPVSTIGYPMGGEQLSITEGVVSRVSYRRYIHHGTARHLLVQVDSAINPGNSGGPVVQGRLVVGVAFQSYTAAENTGYIIPTPVIRRFLKDIESGTYHGHPDDGLTTNEWTMMNPSAAAFHGLGPGEPPGGTAAGGGDDAPRATAADGDRGAGGVKVVHVAEWAPTAGFLRAGDIILEVEGHPVGVDGKVSFEGERVDFRALFDLKLMGDVARYKIVRDDRTQEVTVPVAPARRHHSPEQIYAKHAKYFVYGGLVFTTLSRSFLKTWGDKWHKDAPFLLRFLDGYARYEPDFAKAEDIIVLARRLPDAVNAYATANLYGVVTSVDERPVAAIEDLIAGLEKGTGEFAVIRFFGSDDPLVLSRKRVAARNAAINAKYGVVPDRWLKGQDDDGAIVREAAQ